MLWAVYCVDVPGSRPLRDAHRAAHRAYLGTWLSRIFFSGPLWDDAAFDQTGSLFLLAVSGRKEAEAFVAEEPYSQNGVFATITITAMTKGKFNPALCPAPRERPDLPPTAATPRLASPDAKAINASRGNGGGLSLDNIADVGESIRVRSMPRRGSTLREE